MRAKILACLLLSALLPSAALAQRSGTLNLYGPSTVPGAPALSPQNVNTGVNSQLANKVDVSGGTINNGTLNSPTIVGGSITGANLQPPTTSIRGGVKALTGSNQVLTGIDTTGTPTTAPFSTVAPIQSVGTALTLTGTQVSVNTGTSGATVPLLNGANTWANNQSFQSTSAFFGTGGGASETVRLAGASGSTRQIQMYGGSVQNYSLTDDASNLFNLFAYNPTSGAYSGLLLQGNYGTGYNNAGAPQISGMAPFYQNNTIATKNNGVIGNDQEWGATADQQPSYALGANPITTNGTTTAQINMPGCCGTNGILYGPLTFDVYISGATAVGGVTPSGWYQVPQSAIVDANDFDITLASTATAATGGGSSVTVQPSYSTTADKIFETITTGGPGFADETFEAYVANPAFPSSTSYQRDFTWTFGPNDSSNTTGWSVTDHEADLTNRGADEGYSPNLYGAVHPTIGYWTGPKDYVNPSYPGGGTGQNWNTAFGVFRGSDGNGPVGVYDAYSVQPNALVGAQLDPNAHGGVGADVFGAYLTVAGNALYSTTSGSSNVTLNLGAQMFGGISTSDTVYIPAAYTLNGVTISQGTHAITAVNTGAQTATIVGTGTASATGSGGTNLWLGISRFDPYAAFQAWGETTHGAFVANASSHSDDGLSYEVQGASGVYPGGFGFNDGTSSTAGMFSSGTGGNDSLQLSYAGTGLVESQFQSGTAANPTTAQLPAGYCADWDNTTSSVMSSFCNIGGTITPKGVTTTALAATVPTGTISTVAPGSGSAGLNAAIATANAVSGGKVTILLLSGQLAITTPATATTAADEVIRGQGKGTIISVPCGLTGSPFTSTGQRFELIDVTIRYPAAGTCTGNDVVYPVINVQSGSYVLLANLEVDNVPALATIGSTSTVGTTLISNVSGYGWRADLGAKFLDVVRATDILGDQVSVTGTATGITATRSLDIEPQGSVDTVRLREYHVYSSGGVPTMVTVDTTNGYATNIVLEGFVGDGSTVRGIEFVSSTTSLNDWLGYVTIDGQSRFSTLSGDAVYYGMGGSSFAKGIDINHSLLVYKTGGSAIDIDSASSAPIRLFTASDNQFTDATISPYTGPALSAVKIGANNVFIHDNYNTSSNQNSTTGYSATTNLIDITKTGLNHVHLMNNWSAVATTGVNLESGVSAPTPDYVNSGNYPSP